MSFYSEDFLLERLYNKIGDNGLKGKIIMPKPISSLLNRKTYLNNFVEIQQKIERKHVPSFIEFLKNELSTDASLNGENKLVISGIFRTPTFEKAIKNYCIQYVQCPSCKSGNTEITKEEKIIYMMCNNCKSKKAIQ